MQSGFSPLPSPVPILAVYIFSLPVVHENFMTTRRYIVYPNRSKEIESEASELSALVAAVQARKAAAKAVTP